jgi:hypothetical protein
MTIWRMRIASWVPKATDTHAEYVTLIAFPLQRWLHERVSLLRYTRIACLNMTYICLYREFFILWSDVIPDYTCR